MASAFLYETKNPSGEYFDKKSRLSREEYFLALSRSTTLYGGNLSHSLSEGFLLHLFGGVAPVRSLILGVNKKSFKPCGFCFVEFENRAGAERALRALNGLDIEGRALKLDFDAGFKEGRQYGRGFEGGQLADEVEQAERDMERKYNGNKNSKRTKRD